MDLQRLQQRLPGIRAWIEQTIAAHRGSARSVASLGFARLGDYYTADILAAAHVVAVPRVPMPPLIAMGLPEFADFEQMNAAGITYLDTFFVQTMAARDESLHFHELVHVVQWQHLGPERFLLAYALGHVLSGGYRTNPLEVMAYNLQAAFDCRVPPFDAAAKLRHDLDSFVPALFTRAGVGQS